MTERNATMKKEIHSAAPMSRSPLSQAVGCGDLVFLSGTVGRDPETGEISEGVEEQTRQVLTSIQDQLALAGSSLESALMITVFNVNMDLYTRMNEAYGGFFDSQPPARSCVGVSAIPEDETLVEIEVVAGR